jgi:hypothetical protein
MVINNGNRKLRINLREEYMGIQIFRGKKYYTEICSVIFTYLFSFVLFADNKARERNTDMRTNTERRRRAFQENGR